jgi:predicted DNA binding CopG/RHH family protein
MNKKINYTKGEIGRTKIVDDFLPSPADLVLKEDLVKVTITLSKDSINFFKKEAVKQHIPYQRIIKTLLDKYAKHFNHTYK